MICVCDEGVANMNGFEGLHDPSGLEEKSLQLGPTGCSANAEVSDSALNPIRRSFFMGKLFLKISQVVRIW
jgi:hypothetical protein